MNYELGEEMAMKLSELELENPAPFMILSNIYAAIGRLLDNINFWEGMLMSGNHSNRALLRKPIVHLLVCTASVNHAWSLTFG